MCTDSILKDFNYQVNMPLEYAHVQKSGTTIFDHTQSVTEQDSIRKDVRAPQVEFTFEL